MGNPWDEYRAIAKTTNKPRTAFSTGQQPVHNIDRKTKEPPKFQEVLYPPTVFYKNGEITKINISSTLMSRMFWKLEYLEPCPHKLYHTIFTGNIKTPINDNMIKGLYFEERCIGKSNFSQHTKMPLLKNGKKSMDNIRIDEQIEMFPIIAEHYGIFVTDKNVQVKVKMPVESKAHPNVDISATGTLDIVSPLKTMQFDIEAAVIDIKLTRDRNSEHGKYSWGRPEFMDHTQGVLYSEITGFPFFYLLFDYNGRNKNRDRIENGHKLIPLMTIAMAEYLGLDYDDKDYIIARQRRADLRAKIALTIDKIFQYHAEGYPKNPGYENCADCPLNPMVNPNGTCKEAGYIQRV